MYHGIDEYDGEWITSLALTKDGKSFIGTHNNHLAYFPLPSKPTTTSPSPFKRKSTIPPEGKRLEIAPKYKEDKKGGCDRFNDGSCDPQGRFWVGTMGLIPGNFKGGQFYRYDPDGKVTTFSESIGVSNGLGWSLDQKTMYFIDSPKLTVSAYDFDATTGTISSERTFAQASPFTKGCFDGMCTDAEGGVWTARWQDSKVVRYLPDGTMDLIIELPKVLNVTCCCFGGEDMSDLFITTAAATENNAGTVEDYPQGGDLFMVRIEGVKGVDRHRFGA